MTSDDPIRSFEDLPLILKIPDMVRVYRITESTLRTYLQNGTFQPEPDLRGPYRWFKDTVIRHLKRIEREGGAGRRKRPGGRALAGAGVSE